MTKSFGLPVDEGVPRLRGIVHDEEERVAHPLSKATLSFIGVSAGADAGVCPARPRTARSGNSTHCSPVSRNQVSGPECLCVMTLGFRTKIGLGRPRSHSLGPEGIGGSGSVSPRQNVAPFRRTPFAARVRSQTFPPASTTALAGVEARCAASVVGKFSKRQAKGPGWPGVEVLMHKDGAIRVRRPLSGDGGIAASHGTGHMRISPVIWARAGTGESRVEQMQAERTRFFMVCLQFLADHIRKIPGYADYLGPTMKSLKRSTNSGPRATCDYAGSRRIGAAVYTILSGLSATRQ